MKLWHLAALVAVAAALLVAVAFLALRPAAVPAVPPPVGPQGSVLLIPGYGGGTDQLEQLSAWLESDGIRSQILPIGDGTGDLRGYAVQAQEWAAARMAAGEPPPDVIGYSAGGVTARTAVTGRPELFRRMITLASPHQGTGAAVLGEFVNACPEACRQLQPESDLLESLPVPDGPRNWLSIWSDDDQTIRPPESSELEGASNYRIQEYCDVREIGHGEVPLDPQSKAAVAAFMAGAPLPTTCATG